MDSLYSNDISSIVYNTEFSYENCWKAIIRPHRDIYSVIQLGDKKFLYKYKFECVREDYKLMTKRGFLIQCSFYRYDIKSRIPFIRPCVIYLHGNSSSRIESTRILRYMFEKKIDVFTFDFPGCGLSEGEYISLGYHEQHDVKDVIDFVSKLPGVGNIGLWGRSMGAATALLCSYDDKRVKAICVDSPFCDMNRLVKELCYNTYGIPGFVVSSVLYFVKKTIKSKNNMEFDELNPIEKAPLATVPAIFIHAMNDKLIPLQHTLDLYEKYGGKKILNIVEGDHNTYRQRHVHNKVANFFEEELFDKNDFINIGEISNYVKTEGDNNCKTTSMTENTNPELFNSNKNVEEEKKEKDKQK